jgi:hypothetical protein
VGISRSRWRSGENAVARLFHFRLLAGRFNASAIALRWPFSLPFRRIARSHRTIAALGAFGFAAISPAVGAI